MGFSACTRARRVCIFKRVLSFHSRALQLHRVNIDGVLRVAFYFREEVNRETTDTQNTISAGPMRRASDDGRNTKCEKCNAKFCRCAKTIKLRQYKCKCTISRRRQKCAPNVERRTRPSRESDRLALFDERRAWGGEGCFLTRRAPPLPTCRIYHR